MPPTSVRAASEPKWPAQSRPSAVRTFLPTPILRLFYAFFRKKPRCLRTILPFYAFFQGVWGWVRFAPLFLTLALTHYPLSLPPPLTFPSPTCTYHHLTAPINT